MRGLLSATAHLPFYEGAVQIIPIFMLTTFLGERRIVRGDTQTPQGWGSFVLIALGGLAVMSLGEMATLRTLEQGHDTYFLRGLTTLGITYGFLAIVAQAAKLLLLTRPTPMPAGRVEALGRLYALIVVLTLVGSLEILDPGFLPI